LVALSSAESELYALVKCVAEILGVKSALQDWGVAMAATVKSDASAALGIIPRQGKVRYDILIAHISTYNKLMWRKSSDLQQCLGLTTQQT